MLGGSCLCHGVRYEITGPFSMISGRIGEFLLGLAVVGYCGYALYVGEVVGRTRLVMRRDSPVAYWAILIVATGSGLAFVLGYVSRGTFS